MNKTSNAGNELTDERHTTTALNAPGDGAKGANGRHKASLIVVGTGIRTVGHLTMESVAWIKQADKVLYVVGDPTAEAMLKELNPKGAESLIPLYAEGKQRIESYNQMVERTLECLRAGMLTCMACYGHPGVFVYPSHESIRRARSRRLQRSNAAGHLLGGLPFCRS